VKEEIKGNIEKDIKGRKKTKMPI